MNRLIIFFQTQDNKEFTRIYPIMDDITIEVATKFGSIGDFAPAIKQLTEIITAYYSQGGKMPSSLAKFNNMLDALHYQGTDPLRVTLEIMLYTKQNAKEDVVDEANLLLQFHLPRYDEKSKSVYVPGVTTKDITKATDVKQTKNPKNVKENTNINDNLVSMEIKSLFTFIIPGIIYVPYGLLFSVTPTYSKQLTQKGYPLWAKLQLQLASVGACMMNYFYMGANTNISYGDISKQSISRSVPSDTSGVSNLQNIKGY